MSLLGRLFGPCAFGHGEIVRSRDPQSGALQLSCLRCQEPISTVLASKVERHAAEGQPLIPGQPTGRAIRERRQNVTPWKVSHR